MREIPFLFSQKVYKFSWKHYLKISVVFVIPDLPNSYLFNIDSRYCLDTDVMNTQACVGNSPAARGGSRAAAASKMGRFVIIVNG